VPILAMPSDDALTAAPAAVPPESLPPSDNSLIQRIIGQDRTALSALYARYARVVYSVAYRSLGSVEESEEVVMDVFAKVWTTAASYNSQKARVDTWIFMMTRSRVLDRLRSLQRRGKVTAAVTTFEVPTATNDASTELEIAERRLQITTALASLPAEQRQVLEMAYYQGWSQREIAERTGIALGTVKTRIRLGLEKLRSIPHLIDSL
jgi:RNA polymerase sigma-70 factor, ECF subfamily